MMSESLALLLFAVVLGAIACAINQRRGRSGGTGFAIGFFLGIVGIAIVLGRPKVPSPEVVR